MQSGLVVIIRKYMLWSVPLPELQSSLDAENITNDQSDIREWKHRFRVTKCVVKLPHTENLVSFTTGIAGLIYMGPNLNSMQNSVDLPTSGTVNSLLHVQTMIADVERSKKPTKLPRGRTISVRADILLVVVHLDQVQIISPKGESRRIILSQTQS